MKTMVCSKCNRRQINGKFCLDCGGPIVAKVTAGVKFLPIETKRGLDDLKSSLRSWLGRIGVQQQDIQIELNLKTASASVTYALAGQKYSFSSTHQADSKNNLAAVEMFIHNRVIGIERGIESAQQAFAGYKALPPPTTEPVKQATSGYDVLSREELRNLMFLHHPDTGKTPNREKFAQIKEAFDNKGGNTYGK